MAYAEEIAVFAETNLGTHIAMAVPPDITAGYFKRHLEETHASCLPSFGEIQVYGLMVKRKSCFYYIPESLPIKHLFRDYQAAWFICAEARLLNHQDAPSTSNGIAETRVRDCVSNQESELVSSVSDMPSEGISRLNNTGRKGRIKKSLPKQVPEAVSSSLVNKKSHSERILCSVSRKLESKPPCLDKGETFGSFTPNPEKVSSFSVAEAVNARSCDFTVVGGHRTRLKNSRGNQLKPKDIVRKPRKSGRVGKKLVVASNNIRMQGRKQVSSPSSSICRSKMIRRLLDCDAAASLAKDLVFEIPESED